MKKKAKHLDEMMTTVREHPPVRPLLERQELVEMLETSSAGLPHSGRHHTQSGTTTIMTITGILVAMTAVLLWVVGSETDTTTAGEKTVERTSPSAGADTEIARMQIPENGEERSKLTGPMMTGKKPERRGKEEQGDPEGEEHRDPVPVPGFHLRHLTTEELLRLGIILSEDKVEIEQEEMIPVDLIPSDQRPVIERLGYVLESDSIRLHYRTRITLGAASGIDGVQLGPVDERFPFAPVAVAVMDEERKRSIVQYGDEAAKRLTPAEQSALGNQLNRMTEHYPDTSNATDIDVLGKLVVIPVSRMVRREDGSRERQHLYLWYMPTPELLDALPARYSRRIRAKKDRMERAADRRLHDRNASRDPNSSRVLSNPHNTIKLLPGTMVFKHSSDFPDLWHLDRSRDIQGVTMLDLKPEELARLDVLEDENGAGFLLTMEQPAYIRGEGMRAFLDSLGYAVDSSAIQVQFKVRIDTFRLDFEPRPSVPNNAIVNKPVLVSNRWIDGRDSSSKSGLFMLFTTKASVLQNLGEAQDNLTEEVQAMYMWDNRIEEETMAHLSSLNRLVPVRVMLKSDEYVEEAGQNRGGELLLWYVPTPEFINALPDRYRERLRRELDVISSVEAEGLPSFEVCNRIAGETILGFCRSSSGAVVASVVAPNPARAGEEINLRFRLAESRSVGVTLHDLSGRFIRELLAERPEREGEHQARLSLEGIDAGTYLVAVRTDRGETAVQRVVVQ